MSKLFWRFFVVFVVCPENKPGFLKLFQGVKIVFKWLCAVF